MTNLYFIALVLLCYAILYVASIRGRETLLITMACLCTMSFLFAAKIVKVAGFPLVPSAPLMAIVFYSGTIVQEFFGVREARKILYINLGSMLGFTSLGLLARYMQTYTPLADTQLQVGQAYDTLMDFFPQALIAALAAFTTSYLLNVILTKVLHRMTGDRFFAIRSFISVTLANLWDITAFVSLAYPWSDGTLRTIITTWLMRLVCVLVGVPVLWAIKRRYAQKGLTEKPA